MLILIERLGGLFTEALSEVGRMGMLLAEVIRWTYLCIARRKMPAPWKVILKQMYFIGVASIPVVLITGAFTGMVLAYESYFQLSKLGVTSWLGPLVSNSLVLQLGPVLTGIMLAGRVGGAMTAELGTMAVTEQLDALRTMGTDPVRYLVVPRVLISTALAPLLTGFAFVIGIAAGFGLAIYGMGASGHYMWQHTKEFLVWFDFLTGLTKAAVFGGSMALICCYKGITTRGGAEGVGRATTEANVACCIAVLMLNLFLTMVMYLFDPFR